MPDRGGASRQAAQRSRKPGNSLPQLPCLVPNIAVGLAPLRNLTGDPEHQFLVDGFTDRVVTELFRCCRGFSFSWLPGERRWTPGLSLPNPFELKYVISGSIKGGNSRGMLRANIRISDAVTADYLWAARQGIPARTLPAIDTKVALSLLPTVVSRHSPGTEAGVRDCPRDQGPTQGDSIAELTRWQPKW